MELGHLFEAVMLVCFGFSWPLNVRKAYKARTAKGTSLAFIILIITGYVAGITAKFLNHQINYVLAVYFLNLAIVMTNVLVYIRNVALDKKTEKTETKKKLLAVKKEYMNKNIYEMEENMNYEELNNIAQKNAVILFGGAMDKKIPVAELAQSFEFDFKIYNRSEELLSVKNAKDIYSKNIQPLEPEAILIHIGETDQNLFKNSSVDFDNYYMSMLETIKNTNKNCRVALISVRNENEDRLITEMNRHIKAIADSERCDFINLDSVKLWNPRATKASVDFAYSMGLKSKKPLRNIAEILYSYAYLELQEENLNESLVG
ncbi:MAG: hypothetical protein SOT46_05770 [Treponema sp.]|nr:hypothetical protein [Treponema sp.]MDY5122867.1 hypothetical protein [Treponema sp.]